MASTYLTRTPSSATNQKTFTFSSWCKLSATGENYLISSNNGGSGAEFKISFNANGTFNVNKWNGSSNELNLTTNALYRDFSAWYHVVVAVDTTNATADDRIKIYINGTQETSFSSRTNPSLNLDTGLNNTVSHAIGRSESNASRYYNGYMAEVCFIDGQALTPTSFGEFDEDSGIWKPKNVSGLTFGTNGFYLDFQNSGSLGADVSGNGNNFTVNNLTSDDQVIDTPTNNYSTLNSLNSWGSTVLSEGNTKITNTTTTFDHTSATIEMNSGKWYFEFYVVSHSSGYSAIAYFLAGTGDFKNEQTSWVTNGDGSFGIGGNSRKITDGNSAVATFSDLNAGDIVQIAYDSDTGKAWFGINNTWIDSGNPSTGANPYFSTTKLQNNDVVLKLVAYSSLNVSIANFGQDSSFAGNTTKQNNQDSNSQGDFYYSPPTDFLALNTTNLSEYG